MFSAGDAAILVALISAFAAIFAPVVLLLVSSLKRIRQAAETAAHNTGPNGTAGTPPSPYDDLVSSHEYIIGQVHAAADEARAAARAAYKAQAAIEQSTAALRKRVEAGFQEAKEEREQLGQLLDKTARGLERNVTDGAAFAQGIAAGALDVLGRLDALDGGHSADDLRTQLAGNDLIDLPPLPEEGT